MLLRLVQRFEPFHVAIQIFVLLLQDLDIVDHEVGTEKLSDRPAAIGVRRDLVLRTTPAQVVQAIVER